MTGRTSGLRRHGGFRLAAVLVASGLMLGATAPAMAAGRADEFNCEGISAVLEAPLDNLDALVPGPAKKPDARFPILTITENGQTFGTLLAGAVHCSRLTITPPGSTQESTFVTLRVALADTDPENPPPGSPPGYLDAFHAYALWIASDNPDMVRLYRQEGGVPDRNAVYVPHIPFTLSEIGGGVDPDSGTALGTFSVDASGAPSPFTMSANVGPLVGGPLNITGDFWQDIPNGTMRQQPDNIGGFQFGEVRDGTLIPTPGSDIDRILCDDTDGDGDRLDGDPARFDGDPTRVLGGDNSSSLRLHFLVGDFTVDRIGDKGSDGHRPSCP